MASNSPACKTKLSLEPSRGRFFTASTFLESNGALPKPPAHKGHSEWLPQWTLAVRAARPRRALRHLLIPTPSRTKRASLSLGRALPTIPATANFLPKTPTPSSFLKTAQSFVSPPPSFLASFFFSPIRTPSAKSSPRSPANAFTARLAATSNLNSPSPLPTSGASNFPKRRSPPRPILPTPK